MGYDPLPPPNGRHARARYYAWLKAQERLGIFHTLRRRKPVIDQRDVDEYLARHPVGADRT